MGQLITRFTGGIEKRDINQDYQTYGDGDAYATDANGEYQPSDYDEVEERDDVRGTRRFTAPKQQQQTKRCSCVCLTIFCLALVAVGLAGGTAAYFLHLAPAISAQNVTNGQNQWSGPVVELEPVSATQSSILEGWGDAHQYEAGNCIDGDTGGRRLCHTNDGTENDDATPWIAIDYGTRVIVERVEIFNRLIYGDRARNIDVRISDELPSSGSQMFSGGTLLGHFAGPATDGQHIIISGQETSGRYVIVQMDNCSGAHFTHSICNNGGAPLMFREVKAFGRATTLQL
jgi:hypothetical protein